MKTGTLAALSLVLLSSCLFLRADDTPAQAAARAALEQKFYQLDNASARSSQTNAVLTNSPSAPSAVNTAGATGSNSSAERSSPSVAAPEKPAVAASESTPVAAQDNTAAQAEAFAALKQRMEELSNATNQPSSAAQPVESTVKMPAIAPAYGASVAATPIAETPTAQVPAARTPAMATATAAPVSAVPAVNVSIPEVSSVPAAGMAPNSLSQPAPSAARQSTVLPAVAPPAIIGLPKSSPGHERPANQLVTTSGKIYRNVEVERVTADGILISYTPSHGAWAMTKLPFEDLPANIRQQYQR